MANDFKLFAAGGGSPNTMTPAAWAALTTLLGNGFQTGTANSQQFNPLFRQCSTMAAVLGQLINDAGYNAVDDGTVATTLAALKSTINTMAAPGNLSGSVVYATTQTLPLSDAGKLVTVVGNAAPITLTLPTPVGNSGKTYRVFNQSAFTVSMVTPSGSFIGNGSTSMQPGSQMTIISDGTNWTMFGGSGASSKTANGWKRNDDGTMEQWGILVTTPSGGTPTTTFSFPMTFPNACAGVSGNAASTLAGQPLTATGALPIVAFSEFSTTGARIRMDSNNASSFSGTVYVFYRAIGW